MNQTKQSTRRPFTRFYAVPVLLLLLLAFGASPEMAHGQWAAPTPGSNDITNTNTGNVGIGTAAPAAKLDVNGSAIFSGSTRVAGRGTFYLDDSNVLNFNVYPNGFKINTAATYYNGIFETFDNYFGMRYTGQNVLKVFIPALGSAYFKQGNVGIGTESPISLFHVHNADGGGSMRVSGAGLGAINFIDSSATTNSKLFQWRSEGGLFRMALLNDAENAYVQQNLLVANASGNVGIGITPSAYKLDVNGEINATGLRINGTPIGAGGGSSPWTTNSGNVYYNTGNVGIGTDSPSSARLHLQSPSNTYLRIGAPLASQSAIAFDHDTNVQDIVLYRPGGTRDFAIWTATASNVFTINQGGNVGIGTAPTATNKLEVLGSMNVSGTIKGGVIEAKYQDMAEWVESSQKLEAGTVVALDPERSNQVLASSEAYDTKVAGVISAQPGISLGEKGEGKVLVATTGRVKVKVDATRAPIKIGDLLVTSDVAGVAMKSEPLSMGGRKMHSPGTLIGKALEPLAKGTGEILVLLSLQ
jgi:hypothetical protein